MRPYENLQLIFPLLARLLFSGVFLATAAGLSSDFPEIVRMMAIKGIQVPGALLGLTIAAWLIGGLCLLAVLIHQHN
jgi:hypothetical protein